MEVLQGAIRVGFGPVLESSEIGCPMLPREIRPKVASILCQLAKRLVPNKWTTFLNDFRKMWSVYSSEQWTSAPIIADQVCNVALQSFSYLLEELVNAADLADPSLTAARRHEILAYLTDNAETLLIDIYSLIRCFGALYVSSPRKGKSACCLVS